MPVITLFQIRPSSPWQQEEDSLQSHKFWSGLVCACIRMMAVLFSLLSFCNNGMVEEFGRSRGEEWWWGAFWHLIWEILKLLFPSITDSKVAHFEKLWGEFIILVSKWQVICFGDLVSCKFYLKSLSKNDCCLISQSVSPCRPFHVCLFCLIFLWGSIMGVCIRLSVIHCLPAFYLKAVGCFSPPWNIIDV